jgi:hypothetical protein
MVVVTVPFPGIGTGTLDWAAAPEAARRVRRFRICILPVLFVCIYVLFFLLCVSFGVILVAGRGGNKVNCCWFLQQQSGVAT